MLRSLNPLMWGWLALAMWLGRRDPFRRALSLGFIVFVLAHSAIAHKEERFLIPMAGPAALLLLAMFGDLASRAPSRLEHWLVHARVLGVLAVAGVVAIFVYSAIGLVNGRYRIERSLWDLPAGSHVLADTDLSAATTRSSPACRDGATTSSGCSCARRACGTSVCDPPNGTPPARPTQTPS